MKSLPAYAQIVSMGIQMIAAYRVQAILETASMLLQVFLLRAIWEAVYAGQNQIDGRPLSLVIAYVTIATIQNWLLSPNLAYFLAELVRDGSVGIELVRPVPFLGRLFAQQLGETAFALPFAIASFPLAVLLGGMLPPASPAAAALYVVSFGLGYWIMVLIGLMIGLSSFWTIEIFGFAMIYRLVSAFFGGALIPLWFFPSQLSAVADWLPFCDMAERTEFLARLTTPITPHVVTLHVSIAQALHRVENDPTRGIRRVALSRDPAFLAANHADFAVRSAAVSASDLVIDTETISTAELAETLLARYLLNA